MGDDGLGQVEDSIFTENRHAAIELRDRLVVRRCDMSGNGWGIIVWNGGDCDIEDSDLRGNEHGAFRVHEGGKLRKKKVKGAED